MPRLTTANDDVPELTGMSAREAIRALARLGLRARLRGDGVVEAQEPPAGYADRPRAATISLKLGRQPRGDRGSRSDAWRSPGEWRAVDPRAPTAPPSSRASSRQTVTAMAYDSRQVTPGALFVALRGARHDGAAFAGQAIARGARRDRRRLRRRRAAPGRCPVLLMPDARLALAPLAAAFYGSPSESLLLIGLTGTNGKTTTTYLLSAILDRAGLPCGRIGTVSYRIGAEERPAARTTPEAPDVQRLLREIVDGGMRACAMEVSSHALDAASRRRDAVRRGRVHEPDARSSRFSR